MCGKQWVIGAAAVVMLAGAGAAEAANPIYSPNPSPAYGPPARTNLPIVNPSPAYPPAKPAAPTKPIIIAPVIPPPVVVQPLPRPIVVVPDVSGRRELERYVERVILLELGRTIRDVDVDIDVRQRQVIVEVDLRDIRALADLELLLLSMPELSGYRIRVRVE